MADADPLWPGLHRVDGVFGAVDVVRALVRVEAAWVDVLVGAGLAAPGLAEALDTITVDDALAARVAREAEATGNPVVPLLAAVRAHAVSARAPDVRALHLGLTSQDVLDTALMVCSSVALRRLGDELTACRAAAARLAGRHRSTLMLGRTLGQPAVPTTFGAKVAAWHQGLAVASARVSACRADLPVQVGGAAGTRSALVDRCSDGSDQPVELAAQLVHRLAEHLGLRDGQAWHTHRAPVTTLADTLVTASDALAHVANDVVMLSRHEVAELAEPRVVGRGGSSAMPQKVNPVLSVLVRRHGATAPLLAAQLHQAAASAVDERPDGAWHAEWAPLRELCRRTLVAALQTRELLEGLQVDSSAMRVNLDAALPGALAERLVARLGPCLAGGAARVADLVAQAADLDEFRRLLKTEPGADKVSPEELERWLDPLDYLGNAVAVADRAAGGG